ncbi:MAG: hypothetical protein JKY48_16070 [Flavobacteriales bacterium]|nr:hypothetical protein [Flavobacteriales bacterium]
MKNFRLSRKLMMGAMLTCALSASFTSCKDDDSDDSVVTPTASGAPQKLIGIDITSNTTWSEDTIYVLTSRIKVRSGVTLTINPGTIVKGSQGQEANAKVLMVMRGAKLMADGTASKPIIFTSILDKIQPGEIQSTLPNDLQGQWGGLAILGNAKISKGTLDPTMSFDEAQMEGVPATDLDGRYGGMNDADNSGILRYVSVRHGGTSIGSGNELNGISFGGVGNGTIVENIEIVANADDGLEFYGGTVNAKNIIIWNNGDDALDTDMAYNGTIDNFVLIGMEGSPLELDGPEGSYLNGNHTIKNGTVVTVRPDGTAAGDLINYDVNTNVTLENIHFVTVKAGQKVNSKSRASRNTLTMSNITINVAAADVVNYVDQAEPAINTSVSAGTTGFANTSVFANWTWAEASGALTGL